MPLVVGEQVAGRDLDGRPGSATENSRACERTGSSSPTSPAWTACITRVAVYTLLIDPSWKMSAPRAPRSRRWRRPRHDVDVVAEADAAHHPGHAEAPASSATSPSSRDR